MYYQEGKIRTDIIYSPKGMAREYAALALNHYTGCTHWCAYCYGPECSHKTQQQYFSAPAPKKDILNRIWKDVVKLSKLKNVPEILISFQNTLNPVPGPVLSLPIRPMQITGSLMQNLLKTASIQSEALRAWESKPRFPWSR